MPTLTAHRLELTLEALTPLELNEHAGSALRGALFGALRSRFCAQRHLEACAGCSLVAACPVSTLVSTLDLESERGREVPRPYVVDPPLDGRTRLRPGDRLTFGLTLFARAIQLFPYVILALRGLEEDGLGKRLAAFGGRRGRARLLQAEATNPLTGARQPVLAAGQPLVQMPDIPITHEQVLAAAAGWGSRRLALEFLTPTRLVDQGQLVRTPELGPLFHRLWQRLADLEREFGEPSPRAPFPAHGTSGADRGSACTAEAAESAGKPHGSLASSAVEGRPQGEPSDLEAHAGGEKDAWGERYRLVGLARQARLVEDGTRWVELESYSTRQRRTTPISGFVGRAVYEGELGPLLPWLVWGQFLHVGKDAVKGNGWYVRRDG